MNKKQALDALSNGKRVRHTSAFPNDSIILSDDRYYWEDGNSILVNAFWHHRTDSVYDDNWEEVSSEGLNNSDMKKQYVIARYWRGSYVETMCEPTTQKHANKRCAKLQEKEDPLNEYRVLKIATKNKKVTYI